MCEETGRESRLNVQRPDREYLLRIRSGEFEYEELLEWAERKMEIIESIYQHSDLPDIDELNRLLVEVRKEYYEKEVR